jgi:hypothetical protein
MKAKHKKTLEAIFADPVNGALEWARIEALLIAFGCGAEEGQGSAVAFFRGDERLYVHRPHPKKEALIYRIRLVREFLEAIGENP